MSDRSCFSRFRQSRAKRSHSGASESSAATAHSVGQLVSIVTPSVQIPCGEQQDWDRFTLESCFHLSAGVLARSTALGAQVSGELGEDPA
jgi:hypothetical protein